VLIAGPPCRQLGEAIRRQWVREGGATLTTDFAGPVVGNELERVGDLTLRVVEFVNMERVSATGVG
jgi:hypothetical protein